MMVGITISILYLEEMGAHGGLNQEHPAFNPAFNLYTQSLVLVTGHKQAPLNSSCHLLPLSLHIMTW